MTERMVGLNQVDKEQYRGDNWRRENSSSWTCIPFVSCRANMLDLGVAVFTWEDTLEFGWRRLDLYHLISWDRLDIAPSG